MDQRVIKILPYSYSSLTSFETCPKRHYGERLTKEFARPYNKAGEDGDVWHKQAEQYAIKKEKIPETNPFSGAMSAIIDELATADTNGEGKFHAELELAVDKDKNPVGWWDPNAYTRAKLDIVFVQGKEATSIDWKTGKSDPFSTQLLHSSILLFSHYPDLEKINVRYEWLKEGFATKRTYYREFIDDYWDKFEKRMQRYMKSFEKNHWPTNRNGLCKKYCGVTTCEFFGKSGR